MSLGRKGGKWRRAGDYLTADSRSPPAIILPATTLSPSIVPADHAPSNKKKESFDGKFARGKTRSLARKLAGVVFRDLFTIPLGPQPFDRNFLTFADAHPLPSRLLFSYTECSLDSCILIYVEMHVLFIIHRI